MDNSSLNQTKSEDKTIVELPKKPYKTHGGVHVKHMKNTASMQSELLPTPERVIISMQQHIGAPCEPIVKVGDEVAVGQKIAESNLAVSAPIHSSVSGKVKSIGTMLMANGAEVKTIEIISDGLQTEYDGYEPPVITNSNELCRAVRESGLVGLGGAGFPVSIKLNFSPDKQVDTLVVNGAECEPYLTADCREMLESSEDIIEGAMLVRDILGLKRVIIGIEGNKPEAIEKLRGIIADKGQQDTICVLKLKTSYPHGAEKVLIKACTNRTVPAGKIPADAGCVVLNITSTAFIARYARTGRPLVSKRITVDGSAIAEPKNVIAPIGTPITDIVNFCGGFVRTPKKALLGGPMMGNALYTLDYPIIKQSNGLIFMDEKEAAAVEMTDCIRCAKCVDACPMMLSPINMQHFIPTRDVEGLKDFGVMNCMECGCCSYSCPAHRPLVQFMRMGKAIVKSGR